MKPVLPVMTQKWKKIPSALNLVFSGLAFFFLCAPVPYSFARGVVADPGLETSQRIASAGPEKTGPSVSALIFTRIRLKPESGPADECVLRLDPTATEGFDGQLEAYKLYGFGPNICTIVDNLRLSIQAIPSLGEYRIVPLEVKVSQVGSYVLEFDNLLVFLDTLHEMFVNDLYLGTIQPILPGDSVSFTITSDPSSQGSSRFELIFARIQPTSRLEPKQAQEISLFPNPSAGRSTRLSLVGLENQDVGIRILDARGQTVFQSLSNPKAKTERISLPDSLPPGVYWVRVKSDGFHRVLRWVVQ